MLLILLLFIHGLLHFKGIYAALRPQLFVTQGFSIPLWRGILWCIAGLLFMGSAVYLFALDRHWYYFLPPALVLSQSLIFLNWKSVRFGTFINLYLAGCTSIVFGTTHFSSSFNTDASLQLKNLKGRKDVLITEADLNHLPPQVKKYLHYCRVVGSPRLYSMSTHLTVRLREKGKDFFDVYTRQYNFVEDPTRIF